MKKKKKEECIDHFPIPFTPTSNEFFMNNVIT